ncbi:hypothetical protein BOX37_11445 [Nocardia mangyaensis]|uniref:Uncharacterized protein n=1 Tax=Nocardia mangyaensis TaxID=2213200 RepID=A0A1J0VR23_9NOCA|nr:hypothetical protein [Nocardia mangyaensis]APE34466.1 hypothetical protein BOX37_11445 [Nocardia mangyaensis]
MSTTTTIPEPAVTQDVPPFATRWVGAVALVSGLALFAVLGQYGFFGDELSFLAAGQHLSVSYADQGPVLVDLLLHGKFGWPELAESTDLAYCSRTPPSERTR